MTPPLRQTASAALLLAAIFVITMADHTSGTEAQAPPVSLPAIAIYDSSRTVPLNRVASYRVRVYPKPGYAHHIGVRVGSNLSLTSSCTAPDRVDELIASIGWRPQPQSLFYPVAVWGCGVGGADSSRTLEARVWTTEDNTPPTTFDSPAPDDFEAKPLNVQFIPDTLIPPQVSTPPLAPNKHLYLTSLTLYRTDEYFSSNSPHGRANLEVTSVSPLQSVYPTGLYGRPDARWRNNVEDAEVPMAKRDGNAPDPLDFDWWGPGARTVDIANPFNQLTYQFMAVDHPPGPDGREWDFAGLQLHWRYELDVPQVRYSDVRSRLQEFLEGSLDLPRSMFLLPDWPAFSRPERGLPIMQDPDSHGNVILENRLLGGVCPAVESVEIETLTLRPDRLTGEVVYQCAFSADNPEGLTPMGVAGLHELTLNGTPIHGFNRFVRGKPVVAYGHLTVQASPDPLPNWANTTVYSFPLVPTSASLTPLEILHAEFDIPLEPGGLLAGEYPAHRVVMRLDVDHDFEVPYDKDSGVGYGLPTRRLDFRTIAQSSATEITSCSLQNTNVITNVITPVNPTPPPQFLPTIYQRSIRCWAEYEEITTITPTRWELLTSPNLTPPTFQSSTVTAKSYFITPDPFQMITDHAVPSVALINSDILIYPDTADITTPRPTSLDRPSYTAPVITRHNSGSISLQLGDRAIEPLTIQGLNATVNYDIVATYPTEAATNARCSNRTLTDGLTTQSPDNVGAYALNLPIYACPPIGSGAVSANINVEVRVGGSAVATATVPLSIQRYPTPNLTLSVSSSNISFGGSTDLSVTATGLNPAVEYSITITLPTGLQFTPECTGSSTTINIQTFSLTHHDFIRAYGCGAGTGNITATLQPRTPPGPNLDTDTNTATPQAQPTRTLYDPSQNNQVYFDAD